MGAEDQEVRARFLPARAELLEAFLRAANDKPVAQQRFEGLGKRVVSGQYLVLAPAGIGPVFFRKVGPGHFERRALVLGAIDLARIGQLLRKGLADTRQL